MLSFNYSITKEDFANCYTYILWDRPEKRNKHLVYYGQQVLFNGAILVILLYSGLLNTRPSLKYIYIGILAIIILLQVASGRSKIKKQADKLAEDPDNASLFNHVEMQVTETGIFIKDDTKEIRYNWSAFIRKMENADYYFLSVSRINTLIIPKRVFKTTVEKDSFVHLLTTHLSLDAEVAHLLK